MKINILLLLILGLGLTACGDGGGGDDDIGAAELTAEGWDLFETDNFAGAIAKFDAALVADAAFREANTGLGWAHMRSGDYVQAGTNFGIAKGDAAQLDAFAGNAFLMLAENGFDDAIADAETVTSGDAAYVFSHDAGVDVKDMKLIAAFGYFHTSDYASCLVLVLELNPSFNAGATTQELLAELERLQGEIGG